MVRKLSWGSRRRWSKASRDGALSENIAKADIKASSKGISTSADRGSGSGPKWERSTRKRLSAERSLRTSPGARAIVSHFLDPSGKMGSSGEHYAGGIRERGDQKQRLFKGKTPGRELLIWRQIPSIRRPSSGVVPVIRMSKGGSDGGDPRHPRFT